LLKDYFHDLLNSNDTTKALIDSIKESEWKFCFWVHQLTIPISLKNYGLASMDISFIPYFIVGLLSTVTSNALFIFLGTKLPKIVAEVQEGEFLTWEMGFFVLSLIACIAGFAGITVIVHSSMLKSQKYEVTSI
jgi:uncharacterized membrane protein YdjX (TVP38/TMEM64 family)